MVLSSTCTIFSENRLRLNITQTSLVLSSTCTIFLENRLRLNITQTSLVLFSTCTIFVRRKEWDVGTYSYEHTEFGEVTVRTDARARRIILRIRQGRLWVTCPERTDLSEVDRVLRENRNSVSALLEKEASRRTDSRWLPGGVIPYLCGEIRLSEQTFDRSRIHFKYDGDTLVVLLPEGVEWTLPENRDRVLRAVSTVLSHRAYAELYPRVLRLADRFGVRFGKLTIGHGRSKLGHCTARGDIQLSKTLMLFPAHLVDYVICHELAHLTYLEHSERFHRLCDRYCGGREKELERELRTYMRSVFI